MGSSPHEVTTWQLQCVTRCGAPAVNILQLPFSDKYVHLSVDCEMLHPPPVLALPTQYSIHRCCNGLTNYTWWHLEASSMCMPLSTVDASRRQLHSAVYQVWYYRRSASAALCDLPAYSTISEGSAQVVLTQDFHRGFTRKFQLKFIVFFEVSSSWCIWIWLYIHSASAL